MGIKHSRPVPPFMRYCSAIIPTMFDDSLSYYEALCALNRFIQKNLVEVVNNNATVTQEYIELTNQLKEYMENYFDNLDVQEEINNKLDAMAEDGSLMDLIKAYIDPIQNTYEARVDAKLEEQDDTITAISNMVSSATSGSPSGVYATVAALESADPDHAKIYVVTADGKWYYYNSSTTSWTAGGTYITSAIGEKEIERYQLDDDLRNSIFKSYESENMCMQGSLGKFNPTESGIIENNAYRAIVVPITGGHTYMLRGSNIATTLTFGTTANYPTNGEPVLDRISTSNLDAFHSERFGYITADATAKYLTIYVWGPSSTYDYLTMLASMKCYDCANYTISKSYGKYNEEENANTLLKTQQAIYNSLGTEDIFNPYDESLWTNVMPGASPSTTYAIINGNVSIVFPIENGETYTVVKNSSSTRFRFSFASEYPFPVHTEYHNASNHDSDTSVTFTNSDNYKYVVIQLRTNNEATTLPEIVKGLHIYKASTVVDPSYKFGNLLDNKYINLIKERQLGTLEKGYIAISCDDGNNALATTTIPILNDLHSALNINIPITMGLMTTSPILSNPSYKGVVKDYIESDGASVAIHGANSYTSYSQDQLFAFLDAQKSGLTSAIVAPTSIIYPNHDYNTLSSTIAGTYYGVCCTGGINNPISYGDGKCAGARSNMYTLYRFSLFGASVTTDNIKDAIDYAFDNHMIFLPFFHDITLAEDQERCEALLRFCVTYANSKGLTFINIGDIPTIK